MAKLVLLLLFVCFQFSSQEELGKPENEVVKPEATNLLPEAPKPTELLDGADKNQGQPENTPGKLDEEWTEEDEKWLQQILDLLKESDEDYEGMDSTEFDKLMEELDKYFGESDESDEDWLDDSDEWYKGDDDWDIDLNHYPDYFDKKEEDKVVAKDDLDLYYSWLYKLQIQNGDNGKRQPAKRFTSV